MSSLVTAIDIGSTKVASVIAMVDDEGVVKVIGECSTPSFGVKKGEITGIDDVVNSIATSLNGAERMAGIRVSSAYVSVNGKNILSNNNKGVVTTSDMEINEEDVYRALEQAKTVAIPSSREILHAIPREFIVDQQGGIKVPIGMTGSRLEVDTHIISFPQTTRFNVEKCVQSIGLKIDGIVFTGWASALSVLTSTEKELGVVLLDFGGGTVSISVFEEDAIAYSSSIPFGGTNITKDLAAVFRLSLDDAEKLKLNANTLLKLGDDGKGFVMDTENEAGNRQDQSDIIDISSYGIEGVKTISRKLFLEVIEARVKEILELVIKNIEGAGYSYKLPAGVVVTGGSSQLPFMTQLIKKTFGVPARVAFPSALKGLVEGVSSPSFAVVQGLVVYGVNDDLFRGGGTKFVKTRKAGLEGSIISKIGKIFRSVLQ
ncbi:cell division protein FtsA [Candidatus Dojkabacteria bacterium]|uniref:Cell division protein FtsA n=1 Tax=Candidatus Dojkabacteria bacterium TaxID=2099670 RepID=A0A3M0Z5X3_9BACT|nr:MAG: cell division protein FtsA [Candidatus Dojkabacteria bacterium]